MNHATWLRRVRWPLALGVIVLATSAAIAQDGPPPGGPPPRPDSPPPPGDGPAPPREGRHERIHVLPFDPAFRFKMFVAPVPPALDAQLELKGEGVLVVRVAKGGPADKGGVQDNDVLLTIDDKSIENPMDLAKVTEGSEGGEVTVKLLRAGKPLTVTVTPEKAPERPGVLDVDLGPHGKVEVDLSDLHDIERKIRDKLQDAGVDLRMQIIEPGAILPRGAEFAFGRRTELPDDMSITIHKQGKQPADVEVKQGEETWNVKENDLAPLPDEVRKHVEGYLGHRPMRFNIVGPGDFSFGGPHPPGAPRPPHEGPGRPDGPPPPGGPDGPFPGGDRADGGSRFRGPDGPGPDGPGERGRFGGNLERRLDEMSRRMQEMHEQLDSLRHQLRGDRPRRPERRERPDDVEQPERPQQPDESDGPGDNDDT